MQHHLPNHRRPPVFRQGKYWIDPRIFGIAIIIVIIASGIAMREDSTGYAECNSKSLTEKDRCKNPFMNDKGFYEGHYWCLADDQSLCEKPYLQPGESIGKKPGWTSTNLVGIIFLTTIASFLINHTLHNVTWKSRKKATTKTSSSKE